MAEESEDTLKLFPPPETSNVVPFPLPPSIRELLAAHLAATTRLIDEKLEANRKALLAMPPPDISPKSATQSVLTGVALFSKYGTLIVGVLGVASAVAKLWKPDLVGPIDTLRQLIEGH
jgi:hypothetical protein